MRVAVDGRSLRDSRGARGIARYLACLLEELEEGFPEDRYEVVERRGRLAYAAATATGRPSLDRAAGGCDVAWAPAPAPLGLGRGVPFVLTVHDLSFEHRPEDFSPYERLWHRLARPRRLARRATRVIAVSEAVREQLLEEWALSPEKVVTVRSGPGRSPPSRLPAGAPPHPGCFLVVGALEPRKRPDLIVEAHALARTRGLRGELVFAGDGPLRGRLESAGAQVLGRVGDSELDAIYAGARALVIASREEGFGFTPLEALTRGTAVIAADLAPFAETLGDGALRVPPGDAEALAGAMLRLEQDDGLHARIVAAGRAAAAELSWARAARETRAVLAEAAAA